MTSSEGSPSSVGETEKNKRKRVFLFFGSFESRWREKKSVGDESTGRGLGDGHAQIDGAVPIFGAWFVSRSPHWLRLFRFLCFCFKKNFFLPDQSASAERTLFRWRPATSLFLFRLAIVPSVRSGAIMERKTNGLQLGVEDFSREREREREREFLSKLRHRPRCRYRVLPSFFFQKMLQLDF